MLNEQIIPSHTTKKKKCKKAKLKKEEKQKAKKRGRICHLNEEFQRRARRDKKTFSSEQCKEIEENNRWERLEISTRKREIPTKRTFHAKMGSIKDRNGKDLTEAEEIKKRW